MKRILWRIFYIAAAVVLLIIFHEQVFSAYSFFFLGRYKSLSGRELDRRIDEAEAKISAIDAQLAKLPPPGRRSLDHFATQRDLLEHSRALLSEREGLLAERRDRPQRLHYYFLAGFVVFTIIFLGSVRRVILDRDPQFRAHERYRQLMKMQIDQSRNRQSDDQGSQKGEGGGIQRTLD